MRELTKEELQLVAGAAAAADVDPSEPPTEIPPIVVNPPSEPPTFPPPLPPENPPPPTGGGGGGGDGGAETVTGDSWEYKDSAELDGSGVAKASQSWINPDHNLAFNVSESVNLTDGSWNLAGSGSFTWNGSTYSLAMNTDQFSISGLNASYSYDWGTGLKFDFTVKYDTATNQYSGQATLTVPTP